MQCTLHVELQPFAETDDVIDVVSQVLVELDRVGVRLSNHEVQLEAARRDCCLGRSVV